jgi:hypothetical protein
MFLIWCGFRHLKKILKREALGIENAFATDQSRSRLGWKISDPFIAKVETLKLLISKITTPFAKKNKKNCLSYTK